MVQANQQGVCTMSVPRLETLPEDVVACSAAVEDLMILVGQLVNALTLAGGR